MGIELLAVPICRRYVHLDTEQRAVAQNLTFTRSASPAMTLHRLRLVASDHISLDILVPTPLC